MVEIRIIVEGGGQSGPSDIVTANNTESLRQSLNSFFTRLLCRNDISISVGYGYRNAAKRFIEDSSYNSLFVDSDVSAENVTSWFEKLKTENPDKPITIPLERKSDVYFMIQEMESWFLKQPECFEKWAVHEGYIKRNSDLISNHSLIKEKNDVNHLLKNDKELLRFKSKINC